MVIHFNCETIKNYLTKSAVRKLNPQSYGAISQCLVSVTLEDEDKSQKKAVSSKEGHGVRAILKRTVERCISSRERRNTRSLWFSCVI